jgi:hypothetical protein
LNLKQLIDSQRRFRIVKHEGLRVILYIGQKPGCLLVPSEATVCYSTTGLVDITLSSSLVAPYLPVGDHGLSGTNGQHLRIPVRDFIPFNIDTSLKPWGGSLCLRRPLKDEDSWGLDGYLA